jgi:hypothetical protein
MIYHTYFYNILLSGSDKKIIPIFVYVDESNHNWYETNTTEIIKSLCSMLVDNIELLEERLITSKRSDIIRMNGETITISYSLKRSKSPRSILVYDEDKNFQQIDVAKFSLCPLWIYPTEQFGANKNLPVSSHYN